MERDTTIIPNPSELEHQFEYINSLIEQHRASAIVRVNTESLLMSWEIGQYISGQLKSARWGAKVVSDLADYLKRMNPRRKGYSKRNLYNMVYFYEEYSADAFLKLTGSLHLDEVVQLPVTQMEDNGIVQSLTAQLVPSEIMQSPTAQLPKKFPAILSVTSFTNHVEILNR